MSHFHNNMLLGSAGNQGGVYEIERSLRFNAGDGAFLYRTPSSAGNQKKYTISVWVKRTAFLESLLDVSFLGAGDGTTYGISGTGAFGSAYDGHVFIRNAGANVGYWDIEFRDPSAWYHFVLAIDTDQGTAANRNRLYVNGVEQPAPTASLGSSVSTNINAASIHSIGTFNLPSSATPFAGYYTNAYLAEYNFIDGSQLDHTSFGETDEETGAWIPKRYTGSYGTNGFYLDFSDNSSVSALGTDGSVNGNNWTVSSNFDVGSAPDTDSVEDTPTNNWCTLNPLARFNGNAPTNGNLKFNAVGGGDGSVLGTHVLEAGKKYYWEFEYTETGSGSQCPVGITSQFFGDAFVKGGSTTGMFAFDFRGSAGTPQAKDEGSTTNYGTRPSSGTMCGIALDLSTGKLYAHKGNTYYNSGDPAAGTGAVITGIPTNQDFLFHVSVDAGGGGNETTFEFNFGQQGFTYTAPSGYEALNTANLPEPTIKNGTEYFDTLLETGTGLSRTITSLSFQPDFLWAKGRNPASSSHLLYDSVRGVDKSLNTNTALAEDTTAGQLTSFDSNGYTLPDDTAGYLNYSGRTYAFWNWKESVDAGFDIVTDVGTGAAKTVSHNLGVAPKVIIRKSRTSSTGHWYVYHYEAGASKAGILQLPNSFAASTAWNSTAPTSSVFSVGSNVDENKLNDNYISYLFAEVEGYSKFGTYESNNSTDGPFIFTGFRPAFVICKDIDRSSMTWVQHDTTRNPYNPASNSLAVNGTSGDPYDTASPIDFLSNGFKFRGGSSSWNNYLTETYIYMAFAETPFKYANAR